MPTRVQNFLSALLGGAMVAVAFAALAVGGAFEAKDDGGGGAEPAAIESNESSKSSDSSSAPAPAGPPVRNATDVSGLYERVKNSVVFVAVSQRQQQGFTPFGPSPGSGQDPQQTGSGSGFILDREGYIVTNEHVVDNADQVKVGIGGEERKLIDAKVIGTDASTDLAVLKIDPSDVPGGVTPLPVGTSKSLRVGEPAIAIGSPFGLSGTLTTGVVSALNRRIDSPNNFEIQGVVQTDAAINPGNSGGPLLNARGQVIGVNAQIATSSQSSSGVGFAIPADTVRATVPQLKTGQKIRRAYLGVSSGPGPTAGEVVIGEIVPGGPASQAGMQESDRIVSIGGKDVTTPEAVVESVAARKPGETVQIIVLRDKERKRLTVRLGDRPEDSKRRGG